MSKYPVGACFRMVPRTKTVVDVVAEGPAGVDSFIGYYADDST